ncbi:MAG: hypothetical protein CME26_04790 [Gemmatimonadetes bacterium]|nr:hypothetical protein [Gemmatimonadota bacterium]
MSAILPKLIGPMPPNRGKPHRMRRIFTFLVVVSGFVLFPIDALGQPDLSIQGQILFVTDRDGNDEIYSMNPDGTGQTNLTNDASSDSHAKWGPRGRNIVFVSDRDGNTEIYRMQDDGSPPTKRVTKSM